MQAMKRAAAASLLLAIAACNEPPAPATPPARAPAGDGLPPSSHPNSPALVPVHPAMNSPTAAASDVHSIAAPPSNLDGGQAGAPLRESDSASPASVLACADAWLSRHGLNQYGDPPDTMYPGGTPLFNERTGQRTDRLDFLFAHHADLRADCAPPARAK